MLIVFAGLPGTGKTTLARAVARERQAAYLRIDTIEQALRSSQMLAEDVGSAGYMVAYALAEANLRLGRVVVADSVTPPLSVDKCGGAGIDASEGTFKVKVHRPAQCSTTVTFLMERQPTPRHRA